MVKTGTYHGPLGRTEYDIRTRLSGEVISDFTPEITDEKLGEEYRNDRIPNPLDDNKGKKHPLHF